MANKWVEKQKARDENISKELEPIYKNANCINCPSEWFFPEPGNRGKPSVRPGSNLFNAFTLCSDCKVRKECFNFAYKHRCVGVWGGQLFTDRAISKAKIKEPK